MDNPPQTNDDCAITRFGPWLATLSLVSTAERGLMVACAVLGTMVLIAMFVTTGWWQALALGAGHALLYIAAVNAAPRQWTWRLLGIIVLSLTHVFAFALLSVPGMGIVAVVYLLLGLAAMARYYARLGDAGKQLSKAKQFSCRDDFQWLVTEAPLATRLKLHSLVHCQIKPDK